MYYRKHLTTGIGDPKPERTVKPKKGLSKGRKFSSELKELEDKADDLFREIIKDRDSVNGIAKCFTCDAPLRRFEMECGHFARRGNKKVRWALINGHVQCNNCNCIKDGNTKVYAERLDLKYGAGTAEEILRIAKEKFKPDVEFMNNAIEQMKNWK